MEEVEDTSKYVKEAREVLKDVVCTDKGRESDVTSSMIRNVVDLTSSKSYDEFELRLKHLIARNPSLERKKFGNNLIQVIKRIDESNRMKHLKTLMEYVVMQHAVKAKLEREPSKSERERRR